MVINTNKTKKVNSKLVVLAFTKSFNKFIDLKYKRNFMTEENLTLENNSKDIADIIKHERAFLNTKLHSYTKTEKELMFAENLTKLQEKFKDILPEYKLLADKYIETVAYLTVELQDLERVININGSIEEYSNGARQKGMKVSAATQAHATHKKTYDNSIKYLTALINLENNPDSSDSLIEFIKSKG